MKIFICVLFIISIFPGLLLSQNTNVKSTHAILEVTSSGNSDEYEFEICLVFSDQSNDEPLQVEKKTTPFKFETKSNIIVAIIKCKNYANIQSSIKTFDDSENQLSSTQGTARTFILQKRGDTISFSSIN